MTSQRLKNKLEKNQKDSIICADFIQKMIFPIVNEEKFEISSVDIQKRYGRSGLACFTKLYNKIKTGGRTYSINKNVQINTEDEELRQDCNGNYFYVYDSTWQRNREVFKKFMVWYVTIPVNKQTLQLLRKHL